jgi:hypothetical protein
MADLSDVENAIVAKVIGALYPNGVSEASSVGADCRVYRGWPSPAALNSDLAAGTVNVTIFPSNAPDEVPDTYLDPLYTAIAPTGLLATATGQSVVISGVPAKNEVVGLLADGVPFSYGVSTGDTLESIAANLASLISVDRIAIASNTTLTIPSAISLVARVVTNATATQALRRQRNEIQIICWCPSPSLRDSVGAIVDLAMVCSPFISLSDETKSHVRYISTQVYDQSQNALLYRRDLRYRFEYTTVDGTTVPVMLFGDLLKNGIGSFV